MVGITAVTTADQAIARVRMFLKQVARILRIQPMDLTHAVKHTTSAVRIQAHGLCLAQIRATPNSVGAFQTLRRTQIMQAAVLLLNPVY